MFSRFCFCRIRHIRYRFQLIFCSCSTSNRRSSTYNPCFISQSSNVRITCSIFCHSRSTRNSYAILINRCILTSTRSCHKSRCRYSSFKGRVFLHKDFYLLYAIIIGFTIHLNIISRISIITVSILFSTTKLNSLVSRRGPSATRTIFC